MKVRVFKHYQTDGFVIIELAYEQYPLFTIENRYGQVSERIYNSLKGAEAAIKRGHIKFTQ